MRLNVRIMLPIKSNAGEPFSEALLGRYSSTFAGICGGAFGVRGEGIWTDPNSGICYREPMLALDSDAEDRAFLRHDLVSFAKGAAIEFGQVSIFLRIDGYVELVPAV